jgi:enoyl-[acyl-carrier protein] reductase / trans-2-enoyl-CoA reductase (NAD+)
VYSGNLKLDGKGRICMDDWEMRPEVQAQVAKYWAEANNENITEISDVEEYRKEFFRLFGFEFAAVDYSRDVDIDVKIASIQ